MHRVLGLPISGEDLTSAIKAKYAAQDKVYTRFGMRREKQRVVIPEINNMMARLQLKFLHEISSTNAREMSVPLVSF
jgi:hypothetical protein